MGELLLEEINSSLDQGRSPVKNAFYRTSKLDGTVGNLFDSGEMRGSLEFKALESDHIEVGIFDEDEARKAFGHISGFKGHPNQSKMKKHKREFLPAPNKTFIEPIQKKITRTIQEVVGDGSSEASEESAG